VIVEPHDIFGDGVNIAARLQSAAEPGGVCISGTVYDQIRNKLSLSFKPMGEQRYKNIPQPVRTYSIIGSDRLGTLPTSRNMRRNPVNGKWVGAALVLVLLLLIGGYWAYSAHQQQRTVQAEDGRYAGQVCLGPYREEASRCYLAYGVVRDGRISAKYPAREPHEEVVIVGDVSASGEVNMELSVENSSGIRLRTARLSGTLKNGQLNATGGSPFRTVDIDWHRHCVKCL
jgi:adenylate/guanylate cyclase family protein